MDKFVITIGIFDGLHLGHKKIIKETVDLALKNECESLVFSFSKNPKTDSGKVREKKILTDRLFDLYLNQLCVNKHVIIDFSTEISKLAGRDFIQKLCSEYHVKAWVTGESFRCGYPPVSLGAYELKTVLSVYYPNSDVKVVSPVVIDNLEVSSTALRKYISAGDFNSFCRFAGYPFTLDLDKCPYVVVDNEFIFNMGASVQLLPSDGEYRVYAEENASFLSMPSPKGCDFKAVISDFGRCLKLRAPFKPSNIFFF